MPKVVRVVVRDPRDRARRPHRLVGRLDRVLHRVEPREERPFRRPVLGRTGVEEDVHQPLGDLEPARPPSPAAALHDVGAREDLRALDVDVSPGERDVLANAAAVLLQDEQEAPIARHVLQHREDVLVGRG